jgi:DNA-3-methyladenine glycosylase II
VSIGRHAVAFKIQAEGIVQNPRISFKAYSEQKIPEDTLADRLRFFLSLDDELETFYEIAEKDPPFVPVLKRFYGHKQVKFLTPFENACWAILTQRLPMALAYRAILQSSKNMGERSPLIISP